VCGQQALDMCRSQGGFMFIAGAGQCQEFSDFLNDSGMV
jgi:hypothetical protein